MTAEDARKALAGCRERIDAVDRRILALLNERARIVEQVGRIKGESGLPVYEPSREEDVLRNVAESNGGPLDSGAVRRIFERVIDEMRAVQQVRSKTGPDAEAPR